VYLDDKNGGKGVVWCKKDRLIKYIKTKKQAVAFDLLADPQEKINILNTNPSIDAELRSKIYSH
jgi:hypothetical protein